MKLDIQLFGGRGASSSNNRSISSSYKVQETENGYKGKGSELLKFIRAEEKDSGVSVSASVKKTLKDNPNTTYTFDGEKLVGKSNAKSNAITFNNRQNLISSIQQQINVDLGKATTERQFAPRKGLNIDSKKLTRNEFFTLRTYLNKQNIQINENGVSDYFITYKKQK